MRLQRRSAFGWPATRAGWANPTRGVAVHYQGGRTGITGFDSHSQCKDLWQRNRRHHVNGNGWLDIGYSFGVCPHGYVLEGRGLNHQQAAQPGGNSTWYSVTFMTGPGVDPHPEQMQAFRELRAWLMGKGVRRAIRPHSSFVATACPGSILRRMIRDGSLAKGASGGSGGGGLLERGDAGPAVRQWQDDLREWNPDALPQFGADGDFGGETHEWTRRFQRAADITVDGIVGPETRSAMEETLEGFMAMFDSKDELREFIRSAVGGADVVPVPPNAFTEEYREENPRHQIRWALHHVWKHVLAIEAAIASGQPIEVDEAALAQALLSALPADLAKQVAEEALNQAAARLAGEEQS